MTKVLIKNGEYRNQPVNNVTFDLVSGLKEGTKGLYLTVKNEDHFDVDIENVRIKVTGTEDFVITDGVVNFKENSKQETDDEAMSRIAERFEILDEMTKACLDGKITAMIASGPPGVGKSYGVEAQLEKFTLFTKINNDKDKYEIVKGAITALGLYVQLYNFRHKGNVLVFDDCDSIFTDELSLNILKAALDTSKRRRICWNSDSRLLKDEGIPNAFDFNGSAIFITNLKFKNIRSKKLQDHLEALESRCHYLDLTIDTLRDKILRIKQVHRDSGLFKKHQFNSKDAQEILSFMEENMHNLNEVSIRMAGKLADLKAMSPNRWQRLAENTCMRR